MPLPASAQGIYIVGSRGYQSTPGGRTVRTAHSSGFHNGNMNSGLPQRAPQTQALQSTQGSQQDPNLRYKFSDLEAPIPAFIGASLVTSIANSQLPLRNRQCCGGIHNAAPVLLSVGQLLLRCRQTEPLQLGLMTGIDQHR